MMNPFIASLMQQAEQASKQALEEQNQGFALPMMGFGGGLFGGGPQGDVGGGMPSAPLAIAPGSGDLRFKLADAFANGVQPASFVPTAPIEPTYSPPPMVPSVPQDNGYMSPPVMSTPEATGIIPVAPDPIDVMEAPAPVGAMPTMPGDASPLSSAYTASMMEAPPRSAAEIAAEALGLPIVGRQIEDFVSDGIAPLTADFTAQKAAYVPEVPSIVPVTWDTSRAPLAGVDPNIIQAFEEAANVVNAAGGTYVPTLEMWSGADNHSRNHAGHAADIAFMTDQGSALAWNDPWVQDWSVEAARRGLRQLGAGPTYMKRYGDGRVPIGGDRIHAGGITPGYDSDSRVRVWSDSDPEWGSDYANGISGQREWLSRLNAAIGDPVALGTPIPAMVPQVPWWEDAPMGGQKVGVDEIAGFGGVPNAYAGVPAGAGYTEMDREILARTLAGEAGGDDYEGMLAAGAVIANRVAANSPQYGTGWRGVIMKPYQFSMWNGVENEFTDGLQPGTKDANQAAFRAPTAEAYRAADAILSGQYQDPTNGATHYYANYVSPNWGRGHDGWNETAVIGRHIFGNAGGAARPVAGGVPVAPSVGALSDDDWQSPYNNQNLAIFGGVSSPGGYLYHDWEPRPGEGDHRWSHNNDYEDYSQFYREFTYEPKPGYVPVGERDGMVVYAAPAPEYVNGMPVDRNLYVTEARRRGALIPTEDEMRAFYALATPVTMPTIPNGGGPNDRITFDNVPDGPWYGPKEFYRTNDSPALPLPANIAEAMQNPAILAQILLGGY